MKTNAIILFIIIASQLKAQNVYFDWSWHTGGISNDYSYSIATDASGNVYTAGFFVGISDFDPGPSVFNLRSNGMLDVFISKLGAGGHFVWAIQFGGVYNDYSYSISVDATGNVYVAGFFSGVVDFDPGLGVLNLSANVVQEVFVA